MTKLTAASIINEFQRVLANRSGASPRAISMLSRCELVADAISWRLTGVWMDQQKSIDGDLVCLNWPLDDFSKRFILPLVNALCDEPEVADPVNHPAHYGGADNPYEAIKVIEAWGLGFNLGNTVKYISREGAKGAPIQDLEKARWYLDREITKRKAAQS